MEVLIVVSPIASVMKGFDLKLTNVSKDRFGFVCNTDRGHKIRVAKRHSISSVIFAHEIKEKLHKYNFSNTDRFLLSNSGKPYVAYGADIYIAWNYIDAGSLDFADSANFLKTIEQIAKMHRILENNPIKTTNTRKLIHEDCRNNWKFLQICRQKIIKSGKFSDFDMMFLSGFSFFAPYIEQWIAISDKPIWLDIISNSKHHICHNLLKEENIYADKHNIYFTNFNEAIYCNSLYDLAYIIKRYIRASFAEPLEFASLLDAYKLHNSFSEFELQALIAILLYPDRFIKLVLEYYSKKRSFTPAAYLGRMENIINTKEAMLNYLGNGEK
jgi:CotS family spore coat protein